MVPLLLAHLLLAGICIIPGRRSARWALPAAAIAPAATFLWLVTQSSTVLHDHTLNATIKWVPELGMSISLRLDGFGLLMGLIVSGIGVIVLLYSIPYFGRRDDLGRMASLLVAFAGAMLGLVLSNGTLTLFVFWELTSITSFLLIGFEDRSPTARSAALRALLVTSGGGLALLAGLLLLNQSSHSTTISGLLANPPTGTLVSVALVLVLLGAFTKSAQVPFHFWLPGAMAAPTPVSAYLHSATMVKAGLVVVARFAPAFAADAAWRPLILTAGLASMFIGAVRSLRQQDAKLALAHGTVSQLGLLMVLLGLGTPGTTYAGVAMLLAHALFKASLFLSVGVVDHSTGTRDMRRLTGVLRGLPAVAGAVILAGASMAAIPPMFGFVAKESAVAALAGTGLRVAGTVALVGVVLGSALTVAYTAKIVFGILDDHAPGSEAGAPVQPRASHRPSVGFVSGPLLLGMLSLVFGLAAAPVGHWLSEVAGSLDPASASYELELWGGLHEPLLLSAFILAAGAAIYWGLQAYIRAAEAPFSVATRLYDRTYDALLSGSRRVTAVSQSGSLPFYLGVVVSTLALALVSALIIERDQLLQGVPMANSLLEVAAVAITALLAVSVVVARERFTSALLLGGTGYLLAVVFLIQGAPDLAVTQFLVETLSIVVFMLVLARLPRSFSAAPSWAPRAVRLAIAGTVGVVVAVFALTASHARSEPSVGKDYVQRSEREAGGRNVVNVILVDFRGFDTMGEITVLAVAGAGVVNLVGAARREQRRKRLADGTDLEEDELEDRSGRSRKVWM